MEQNEMSQIPPAQPSMPGRGTMILVLGILSIVLGITFCVFLGPALGIPAWVMGKKDEQEILKGVISQSELPATKAGKVCGIIGTIFGIAFFVLIGLVLVFVLPIALSSH
jgi:hypothetical protein